MRAQDVMTAPVLTATPGTPAKQVADVLAGHGFTALPVVDDDDRLLGIVTEADLIRDRIPRDTRYVHGDTAGRGVEPVTVGDVMTSPARSMPPTADVHDLCQALVDHGIRAMPIVDGDRLVGIVTRGDVVRVLARTDAAIALDVRHKLQVYGGSSRWGIEVRDGVVRIVDQYDDETDRHVATLLARAVPGVVDAETVSTTDV